jgi:ABC-type transporter Mla subunit MlaD
VAPFVYTTQAANTGNLLQEAGSATKDSSGQQVMNDRRLGYFIIGLCVLIVSVVAAYGINSLFSPGEKRVVAFARIGNLKCQDPVRVRGVNWGMTDKIDSVSIDTSHKTPRVFVSIRGKWPLAIHQGYRISDMDEGLMGDRAIMIDCGDSLSPTVPATDTLAGTVYPGVSEALNNATMLRQVMDTLLVISNRLVHGTRAKKSFTAQVHEAVATVDSLSRTALSITRESGLAATTGLDTLSSLVNSVSSTARAFEAAAPAYENNITATIRTISAFAGQLDKITDTLRSASNTISNPNNILWKNDVENTEKRMAELRTLISSIQQKMIQFKIYLNLL